ncbi:MAG: transposase [Pirellulales bacterium]
MPRGKKYGPEEIIPKLRAAEVLMSQGMTQELAAKQIGVSTQTLIRWRKEYCKHHSNTAARVGQKVQRSGFKDSMLV